MRPLFETTLIVRDNLRKLSDYCAWYTGTYAIAWTTRPTALVPLIDIDDYGLFVRQVLELPVFPDGAEVYTSSEEITLEEIARQLSEGTGKNVVFKQITIEEGSQAYEALGMPPAISTQIIDGFRFFDEFGYYGGQPSSSREGLARPTRTWAQFVKGADWSRVLA
ncbi:hypothetical protein C8R47DRAFT_1215076 [Mycena vitilis]|nr:hypothetical protein C8R47DRAFT_1215076 [Mycena vitilis]